MNVSTSQTSPRKGLTQYERLKLRLQMVEDREAKKKWEKLKETPKKKQLLAEFIETLRLKRLQCLNTWGRLDEREWQKVKEDFISSVLEVAEHEVPLWMKEIDRCIGRAPVPTIKPTTVDHGARFEIEIAVKLQALGWNVQLLGKSGDQGGDLLVQKANKSVVIQCKHYASKAGNTAVQEVIAGRQFYHTTIAAVVAPAGFTRQAYALADKAAVLLLSPDQLTILG